MKYFKITLDKNEAGLVYPENYQTEIGDKAASGNAHLYYNDDKGNSCLLLAIKDADSAGIVRDGVVEITESAVEAISAVHEPRMTRFSDQAEVERIKIKVLRGLSLTADEEKALDPDDDTVAGFTTKKRLVERIATIASAELIE